MPEDVQVTLERWKALLSAAYEQKAGEILLAAGAPPMFRIGGGLVSGGKEALSEEVLRELIFGLLSGDQAEKLQRDGEVDFSFGIGSLGRYVASVFRQRGSLSIALHYVPWQVPTLEEIAFPANIRPLLLSPSGLFLLAGAAGSGKAATWASAIQHINENRACHILTLEDPITYVHKHKKGLIEQRQIGSDVPGFEVGLTHCLHQRADVIALSEFCSAEVIQSSLSLAETGHFVLAPIMARDAVASLTTVVEVFSPQEQPGMRRWLSRTLLAVVAQQLLPRVDGKGRAVAYEVLLATPEVRGIIASGNLEALKDAMNRGKVQGMQTFSQATEEMKRKSLIA
jgi:twitching motility protein PilT